MIGQIAFICFIVYLAFVSVLIYVWASINTPKAKKKELLKFSILIPIRNEELYIGNLLHDLNKQHYDKDHFEIIVIDDHSTDGSKKLVEELKERLSLQLKFVTLDDNQQGKKAALEKGIQESQYDTIITTDGDCRVSKNWMKQFNTHYLDETVLVFGGVDYNPVKTVFDYFQALELSALIASGGVANYLGVPGMCNGANFSFKKSVFYEVGGYKGNEKIPSGDDEFLLRKIRKKYTHGIKFMKDKGAFVLTEPLCSWKDLLNQKVRWASKWKYHSDFTTKLLGVLIFLFNMSVIIMLFSDAALFILLLSIKVGLEYMLAMSVIRSKNKFKYILPSIFTSIVYPYYAIVVSLISIRGKYSWKGRSY